MSAILDNTNTFCFESLEDKISNFMQQIPYHKDEAILLTLLNCIDLTSLNTADTTQKIIELTQKVNNFSKHFPNYGNVAAICVYPSLVPVVAKYLEVPAVKIASVGASFPSSQTFLSVKAAECELIVRKGANEVDIVISVGSFLEKDYKKVAAEINIIKHSIGDACLKVILETGELETLDNIYHASYLAMESGADFIKTSTGKTPISATPAAVYAMCCAIKDYYDKNEKQIGIKPSGGMSKVEDAILYYIIVKEVLGQKWLNNKYFRLGTSKLGNAILSDLTALKGNENEIKYF